MPKTDIAPALPRKPKASATSTPSAAESLQEAERLTSEGLHIRWAHERRRMQLLGQLDFVNPKPQPAPARNVDDLVPAFLKKWPQGWQITEKGFVRAVERPDAKAIAKLTNARRDELGVYSCEKDGDGWRFVVEF